MTTVEMASPSIANIFPGKVIAPDGTITDQIRAVITPSLLVVYGEGVTASGMRSVETKFKVTQTSMRPDPEAIGGWIVTDDAEQEWKVRRGSGCGCGSPLKVMASPLPVNLP